MATDHGARFAISCRRVSTQVDAVVNNADPLSGYAMERLHIASHFVRHGDEDGITAVELCVSELADPVITERIAAEPFHGAEPRRIAGDASVPTCQAGTDMGLK